MCTTIVVLQIDRSMDRLLSSSSPPSLKSLKPLPFFNRFHYANRFNLSPLKRTSSICCNIQNPSPLSSYSTPISASSKKPNNFISLSSSSSSSSSDRSVPQPNSLNQIATGSSQKPKVLLLLLLYSQQSFSSKTNLYLLFVYKYDVSW